MIYCLSVSRYWSIAIGWQYLLVIANAKHGAVWPACWVFEGIAKEIEWNSKWKIVCPSLRYVSKSGCVQFYEFDSLLLNIMIFNFCFKTLSIRSCMLTSHVLIQIKYTIEFDWIKCTHTHTSWFCKIIGLAASLVHSSFHYLLNLSAFENMYLFCLCQSPFFGCCSLSIFFCHWISSLYIGFSVVLIFS